MNMAPQYPNACGWNRSGAYQANSYVQPNSSVGMRESGPTIQNGEVLESSTGEIDVRLPPATHPVQSQCIKPPLQLAVPEANPPGFLALVGLHFVFVS